MLSKTNIFANDWVNLVFDNRNHAYGAFVLRKESGRNTMLAVLCTVVFFGLSLSTPIIINYFRGSDLVNSIAFSNDEGLVVDVLPDVQTTMPDDPTPSKPKASSGSGQSFVMSDKKMMADTGTPNIENPFAGKSNDTVPSNGKLPSEGNDGVDTIHVSKDDGTPYIGVEIMPEFPGGPGALKAFIRKNLVYPPIAKEMGIDGNVFCTFVVERDGSLSNFSIRNEPHGYGLEEEAMRVVKTLPKFSPGMQNGHPVRVWFTVPIKYRLN